MSEIANVEQTTQQSPWPGVVFLLCVLTGLVYAGVKAYDYLQDEQSMPVQVVDFLGDIKMVNTGRLETLIRRSQPGSFFALDVNEVHALIEAQPWVYRASVRKQWPSTLKVYIFEQDAVARWNDDMLLNRFGDTFSADATALKLPSLFGPNGSEKTALQGFNAMQALLETASMSISELFLSERFAWQIQLQSGVVLKLGRHEFIDRVQRFIDLKPLLNKENKQIEYIDLRYDTGLAVGWQQAQPSEQNSKS